MTALVGYINNKYEDEIDIKKDQTICIINELIMKILDK